MLNKTLFLEIDKPNYVPIYTVQYDYNSRFYEITILNNSQPLDLTGIRVIVAGKKPDGKEVFNSCKVLDAKKGLIQLELTEQMNAVNGASEYALELFSADGMLSSQPLKLIVTRSTISKSVESSKELGALKDALNEVQDIDNRFAQTNAQLSDKITHGDVSVLDINKNKGLFDETYFTDDFKRQFITNEQPLHTTPHDNSITQEKMVKPYVEAVIGKNIFNPYKCTSGYYVNSTNGNVEALSGYLVSEYIEIESGESYQISGTNEQVALYNVDKQYVMGYDYANELTVIPSGVKFIRMTVKSSQLYTTQLEKSEISTSFEPFNYYLNPNSIRGKLAETYLDDVLLRGIKSPNLFNKNSVKSNTYIDYRNGKEITLQDYNASDFIQLEPNERYSLQGTEEQFAFYDHQRKYVSGSTGAKSFQAPSNAYFIRLTIKNTQLDTTQLEKGDMSDYLPFGYLLNPHNIHGKIPTHSLDDRVLLGRKSINLFNKHNVTVGSYVMYSSGKLDELDGYCASDYIRVEPNTEYRVSGTTEQLAFYDRDKNFISGLTLAHEFTSTPENCYYVRLSMRDYQVNEVQLQIGDEVTEYEGYGLMVDVDNIPIKQLANKIASNIETITYVDYHIKADGTGDFENPVIATKQITDSSKNKQYRIYIHEGVYPIIDYLGGNSFIASLENNTDSMQGWFLPDYVHLIGIGKVELKGVIPDDLATLTNTQRVATIEMNMNNNLENLTVTAKNMRYAIHDERNGAKSFGIERHVKNCHFIHHGNKSGTWGSTQAIGQGTGSKGYYQYDNCVFESQVAGFSSHTNVNFDSPDHIQFNNCDFINTLNPASMCVRLGSMESNQVNIVEFNNCKFTGVIQIRPEQTGKSMDYKVIGGGNSFVGYDLTSDNNGVKVIPEFSGEIQHHMNKSNEVIEKGKPVKLLNGVITPLSGDDHELYYGITWNNVNKDKYGIVKVKGYIPLSDLGITASVGQKLTLSPTGTIEVNGTGKLIGIVTIEGQMLMK